VLDALANGQPLPADATEQARVVAMVLASLAGPADPSELAGEAAARFAFASSGLQAATQCPSRRSRPSWLPVRLRVGLTAGLLAAAIGVGGAAAAYAGVLPGPIQKLAHYLIHAPSPRPAPGQQQQHPADHRPGARPLPGKHGAAVGKGNAHHRRKAHHPRPHHPKASHHPTTNYHHKAGHPGARSHLKARGRAL